MQDINPIRKTLDVKESATPDSIDLRASVGVADINHPAYTPSEEELKIAGYSSGSRPNPEPTLIRKKEEVAFSSLYTPESRRNVVNRQPPQNSAPIRPLPPKKKNFSFLYGFLFFCFLVLGFVLYTYVFETARVSISPVRTNVELNKLITLPASDIELASDIMTITATSSDSKDVPRRGATKVETKASGIITVYNGFDANPQKLITNTRFESKTGKTYRIAESVTVPGMKGGIPGSVDVTVFADSVGPEYNSEVADFVIPGFKGTPRFSKFYAKTKTKLAGGASGTQDAVADEDILLAHNELLTKIKTNLLEQLKKENPGEQFVFLADATKYIESDNKNELVTDPKAKYILTVQAKGYFVKKDYLAKKLLEGTNHSDDENLVLEDESQIIFGGSKDETKTNVNDVTFTVTGNPSFISKIDEVTIKSVLSGKPKSDFQTIMTAFKGVSAAEPHFNPFWLRSFPSSPDKIKIEISK
jgi:hypothetical protein